MTDTLLAVVKRVATINI